MAMPRLPVAAGAALVAIACAQGAHPPIPGGSSPAARIAAAAAQVRGGCLDCLEQAFEEYRRLASDRSVGESATESAARTALLIAVRENELGLIDSGRLRDARRLIESPSPPLAILFDVAEALSSKPPGVSRSPLSDAETRAISQIARNQQRWAMALRQLMPDDLVADYLWLGLACGPSGYDIPDRTDRTAVLGESLGARLVSFKEASNCSAPRDVLRRHLDEEPRFVEVNYFLGASALAAGVGAGGRAEDDIEEADARFQAAYAWRPRWPLLTIAIANIALTAENFDRAIDFYGRTLALVEDHPEALLGSVRALTYAGRHEEAIAATDRLLSTNRNPGEARYWRALNEEQLERHDAAWADIERASEALVSPDVPKLAGIIAINRRELDVARQRLGLAWTARPADCETGFYLQAVLTQQGQWSDAAGVASSASTCFDANIGRLSGEIEALRGSDVRPDRRDRQIARREQQLKSETRMRAASWYDAAAANFNLSRPDEARQFAEKLLDDEQYRDRAGDLLGRLRSR